MSGTESENDYESADDDTEENSSTAEKNAEPEEARAAEFKEKDKNEHSSAAKAEASEISEEKSDKKPETQTSKDVDSQKSQSMADESAKPTTKQDTLTKLTSEAETQILEDKNFKELQSVPDEDTKQNKKQETLTKSSSETSKFGQVVDSQPKRVTLRLEKKIQQKNRTASVESEKLEESKPAAKIPSSSSWGFGSWGASLLSTATASVSTFTTQVSQGVGTLLETVESSLGAPPPEDLAAVLKERKEQEEAETVLNQQTSFEDDTESVENEDVDEETEESDAVGTFTGASSLFTGVTSSLSKVIESTSAKVIMGGLDTLELIGKKTMDILTEGDPGLRKKRSAFSRGVNLSQILREAKEKAEADQANMTGEDQEDAIHFTRFFDENQGLVHLEALEMLSSQCQQKVQGALMVSGDSAEKELLEQISRICEDLPSAEDTPDDEIQDFDAAVGVHIKELQIPFNLDKIKKVRSSVATCLDSTDDQNESHEVDSKNAKEIYRQSISSLAEFTACCVEQFHKFGELILVQAESDFDILMCATHLTGLTSVLCAEIGSIATLYCQKLNAVAIKTKDNSISAFITSTYLESSNSTTYVQDAFQLLVPVLQSITLK